MLVIGSQIKFCLLFQFSAQRAGRDRDLKLAMQMFGNVS